MGKEIEFTVDGSRLTSARIEAGKSLDEAIHAIGCNKSTLSRWEREITRPAQTAILRLIMLYDRHDFVKWARGGKDGN